MITLSGFHCTWKYNIFTLQKKFVKNFSYSLNCNTFTEDLVVFACSSQFSWKNLQAVFHNRCWLFCAIIVNFEQMSVSDTMLIKLNSYNTWHTFIRKELFPRSYKPLSNGDCVAFAFFVLFLVVCCWQSAKRTSKTRIEKLWHFLFPTIF